MMLDTTLLFFFVDCMGWSVFFWVPMHTLNRRSRCYVLMTFWGLDELTDGHEDAFPFFPYLNSIINTSLSIHIICGWFLDYRIQTRRFLVFDCERDIERKGERVLIAVYEKWNIEL